MFMFCGIWRSRWSLPSRQDDHGATAVEYSLLVGLIAAVIVGAVTALGLNVLGLFNTVPPGL
jgi:pilus assembly protein Flp/PilA